MPVQVGGCGREQEIRVDRLIGGWLTDMDHLYGSQFNNATSFVS